VPQQYYSVSFFQANGQPLANGYITIQLNTDATVTSTGPQIVAGRILNIPLDNNGYANFLIWPNSQLSPSNTVYLLRAYSLQGELAWSGQFSL
jgi:hypothetical protein